MAGAKTSFARGLAESKVPEYPTVWDGYNKVYGKLDKRLTNAIHHALGDK